MKNPNQLAKDLPAHKWIWATSKGDFLAITIFSLLIAAWLIIKTPETWWAYGILLPGWYCLHLYRWYHLYKKNLKFYHNWEETFGNKFSVNNTDQQK